jgi:hypothetical protein
MSDRPAEANCSPSFVTVELYTSRKSRPISPDDAEIQYLLDIVNREHYIWDSDTHGIHGVFPPKHTIYDRPFSTERFYGLVDRDLTGALRAIARGKRPRIPTIKLERTQVGRRYRLTVAEKDLSGRLWMAVEILLRKRAAIRECSLCAYPNFFRPTSRESYCSHCARYSMAVDALRIESTRERVARHRLKRRVTRKSQIALAERELACARQLRDAAERTGNVREEERWQKVCDAIENKIATLNRRSRRPPAPLAAKYEISIVDPKTGQVRFVGSGLYADALRQQRRNRAFVRRRLKARLKEIA